MACCKKAPRAFCICGGQACAECSDFVAAGVVLLTLGGDGSQSMDFLVPAVARMFGARSVEVLRGRRVRMVGCTGTAHELRARWRSGISAQRPLNFGELGLVAVSDVGTPTCASSQICDFMHIPCASCGGCGAAIVRPCEHTVCVVCAFGSDVCARCPPPPPEASALTKEGRKSGAPERVVDHLGRLCSGTKEFKRVLRMLTAVASFATGPIQLAADDEMELLAAAVLNAEPRAVVGLIHAVRSDVLGLYYHWHAVATRLVGLFLRVGEYRGQPLTREHLCRAANYWKQMAVAEAHVAAVKIQALVRGWRVRRRSVRHAVRRAAATKIQALWRGWSHRRQCYVCLEMGAQSTQCACRNMWAHPRCLVDACRRKGEWGLCALCHRANTGEVGLSLAGHAHEQAAEVVDENPAVIIGLAELTISHESLPFVRSALPALHGLMRELQNTTPAAFGGVVAHRELVTRIETQYALAEACDNRPKRAVTRLRASIVHSMPVLGRDHPLMYKLWVHLARIYFDCGDFKLAYDTLDRIIDGLDDIYGPDSPEALYYGRMTMAAAALMLVDRCVVLKTRHFFWFQFERLRRVYGPAHPYTLAVIKWRKSSAVNLPFATAAAIEHECAAKIQAWWRKLTPAERARRGRYTRLPLGFIGGAQQYGNSTVWERANEDHRAGQHGFASEDTMLRVHDETGGGYAGDAEGDA
jgi:hypothetical protein